MSKKAGRQTIEFENPPTIAAAAAIAGKKEGEGPLGLEFDETSDDDYFGEDSWEKAEAALEYQAARAAVEKSGLPEDKIDYIFSGDLQNQCTSTHYSMRKFPIPFFGVYGACSTACESLLLAAMTIDGGFAENILCGTSSHFCSAEKQFRFPLEYGGLRTPTSQWTVTGSGFMIVSADSPDGPRIKRAATGKIIDMGITDINNMGGAMAPAAADTIAAFFKESGQKPSDYDLILTGDLGEIGSDLLRDLLNEQGYDIYPNHNDCGLMIYDRKKQDVHAGGSGCGCSASVFCGHIYKELKKKNIRRMLFIATGALMNPQIVLQKESIPSIAHLVEIEI